MAQKNVIVSHGSAECLQKEKECLHAYVSITKAEKAFLKQKARNQWLQLGDHNNAYFHCLLKARHARNTITHLWDEHGTKVEDVEKIKEVVVDFYKELLGTNHSTFHEGKATRVSQLITPHLPVEQVVMLAKDITAEEIRSTMFSMKANKAPGPDGFTSDFLKSAWSIVGVDVVAAI